MSLLSPSTTGYRDHEGINLAVIQPVFEPVEQAIQLGQFALACSLIDEAIQLPDSLQPDDQPDNVTEHSLDIQPSQECNGAYAAEKKPNRARGFWSRLKRRWLDRLRELYK